MPPRSVIDRVVRHDPDGTPVTVFDHIVNALRNGAYFEQACSSAGIHKDTAYGWRKLAANLRAQNGGQPPTRGTTANEKRYLAFSVAVEEAEAAWEVDAIDLLGQLQRGGLTQVKTVVKRGPPPADGQAGPVLESVTTTERLAPNAHVLLWRLERRFPKRYGRRVEVTGEDGGPIELTLEERADTLATSLESFLEGAAASRDVAKRSKRVKGGADTPGSS